MILKKADTEINLSIKIKLDKTNFDKKSFSAWHQSSFMAVNDFKRSWYEFETTINRQF